MLAFLTIIILGGMVLLATSLLKTYSHIPAVELKRRSRDGDPVADLLYKAAAYGTSLSILLWVIIGLCGAGFFMLLSRSMPAWLALLGGIVILWLGFAWVPTSRVSRLGALAAARIAPYLSWLLNYLHPALDRLGVRLGNYKQSNYHTGLYQKEDLLELINRQNTLEDNRIAEEELAMAFHALTLNDKLVRDAMTPKRVVKSVAITDSIGPVLMGELHDSGHSRFPVYEKKDKIVGTLYIRDLIDVKSGGQVQNVMKKEVYFVHEEQTLHEALSAFLKTRHHLFIVVNSFEEYVGIITIEDVLEQLIGKQIVDESDKYDDLRAVAAKYAKKEHKEHTVESKSENEQVS